MIETTVYWGFRTPDGLSQFQKEIVTELRKTSINCRVQIRAPSDSVLHRSVDLIQVHVGDQLFKIYESDYDKPIRVLNDKFREPIACYDAATAARVIVKEGKKQVENRIKFLTDILKSIPEEECQT
jgi:hypothetical protein